MGVYIGGKKIGYSMSTSREQGYKGAPGKTSESLSVLQVDMLGSSMSMKVQGVSYFDTKGKPVRMESVTESAGRKSSVVATFTDTEILAKSEMGGRVQEKTIDIPAGARIGDDPMTDISERGYPPIDKEQELLVFDTTSLSLVKVKIIYKGKVKTELNGKEVEAHLVQVNDPRAALTAYLDAKGEPIKITGPFGMTMIPEPKEKAMDMTKTGGDNTIDLAGASSIKPNVPIKNWLKRKTLKIRVTGCDISKMPSDEHQTITKDGDGFVLEVHPVDPSAQAETTIRKAANKASKWVKADTRLPATSPRFRKLAKELIGSETSVLHAAEKARNYVFETIKANAGIGVMRDADDILDTKEGVCRDHAVLLATILRAGGIPTRLVSGVVYGMGRFYYHAWVEVFNGTKWVGFDSTRPASLMDATHIKTAQGTVEEAMQGFLMDGAKFEVLDDKN
jgi:hypothetical protein